MSNEIIRWNDLHAFVAMPYGKKEDIDFNKVYDDYIKPALESVGFDVFRADKEMKAGNIRTDMFQELLLADLVVVDLSIDNPNVWYELGVRHALRSRGVIQIQSQRDYLPFDVFVDRTLKYHIKNGVPDPEKLENDKKALAEFAVETMKSWHSRKISPVYHLLCGLREPDWKSFRIAGLKEFWSKQKEWKKRIEIAYENNRPGDILLLAEEAPYWVLRFEAFKKAGQALLSLGQYEFAFEQYDKALKIDQTDLVSRQKKGILLGRLGKYNEAKINLEGILQDHPEDSESWGLLGRVQKDKWCKAWRADGKTTKKMREDAASEDALLRVTIQTYENGFMKDPGDFYPGINCIILIHLLKHLTGSNDFADKLEILEGGVRWAVHNALNKDKNDYWARVTLGDIEVLRGDIKTVKRVYENAVPIAEKDWFALDSSRQQLLLLQDLEFRPGIIGTCINIFDKVLNKLKPPEKIWEPRYIFLFSGHMIDKPGRKPPRFPEDKEPDAVKKITRQLDELGAGQKDLALCGGACGGDLLFAEACLQRGLQLEIRIPFPEPLFLKESVGFAGNPWRDRFYRVKENPQTKLFILPEELGPLPKGSNPYERNNLWQLYTAMSKGLKKVKFICLWDGKGGDGPGGTKHMHDVVERHSGHVYVIDTNKLFNKSDKS